jgi:RNA polymerase sigma factor (TIGR02999 family)
MSDRIAAKALIDSRLVAEVVARDQMLAELYDDLRAAAARLIRMEAPDLTMQPTELVNEAALRVMKLDRMSFVDRQHLFATGARILRQAMLDAIRRRRASKRQAPVAHDPADNDESPVDVELLDLALTRLETAAPDLARIVELRFFVGLGIAEVAAVTGTSETTVKRRWQTARIWLAAQLDGGDQPGRR